MTLTEVEGWGRRFLRVRFLQTEKSWTSKKKKEKKRKKKIYIYILGI